MKFFDETAHKIQSYEHNKDSETNVRINEEIFGKEWYYYKKEISYINNEEGFRTRSFIDLDWSNCVVVLGCSNIKGTGNALEDTVGVQLEKILNIPVISLGISGAGVDLTCRNSLVLHNTRPFPKAVVQVWTGLDRYCDFSPPRGIKKHMANRSGYCFKHDWGIRSQHYIDSDRALWQGKTIYSEHSFFKHTADTLGIDFIDEKDQARDLDHPGYLTNRLAAEQIAQKLIEKGLK